MSMPGFGPQDAGTVAVRVQVIDVEPFALDLVVPTYIPAKDLTQRVARDAGLGAYWEDGTRRLFWLRARGRVMGEEEKLQDLGVIPGELLHLLPQPPLGSGVMERPPEYPETHPYAGAGWVPVLSSMAMLFAWTAAWAVVLTVQANPATGLLPGMGLAVLSTSFSRHLWGGSGRAFKIPMVGLVVFGSLLLMAGVPAVALQVDPKVIASALVPGAIGGLGGVLLAWLAWFGAVEPLPRQALSTAKIQAAAAQQVIACGICGQAVDEEHRADCVYKCGRVFHSGCYRARQAMAGPGVCGVCGFRAA